MKPPNVEVLIDGEEEWQTPAEWDVRYKIAHSANFDRLCETFVRILNGHEARAINATIRLKRD